MQNIELSFGRPVSKLIAAALTVCGLTTSAFADGARKGKCERFEWTDKKVGIIMGRVDNTGFGNDGTLVWPNGQVFLMRSAGFYNDRELYYPDGKLLQVAAKGYENNKQVYWPNDKVMRLANRGGNNDGSIMHADGSNWLLRNRGGEDDLKRFGAPTDQYRSNGFSVAASLTNDNAVSAVTTVTGPNWTLRVYVIASAIDQHQDHIFYDECL